MLSMTVKDWTELHAQCNRYGTSQVFSRDTICPMVLPKNVPQDFHGYLGRPIMGKVLILPVISACKFTYDKPWACISITEDAILSEEIAQQIDTENRIDLLPLFFHDVTQQSTSGRPYTLFTQEQASETAEFVKRVWNDIDLLMIHCHAGISRSSAIGKVVCEKFAPEFGPYFSKLYRPNSLVYNLMKEWL